MCVSVCLCLQRVKLLSPAQLFVIPWTVAYQAPLSMGFSRQEYWSGLLCPSPGDLHNPGIEPRPPAFLAAALPSEPPGTRRGECHKFVPDKRLKSDPGVDVGHSSLASPTPVSAGHPGEASWGPAFPGGLWLPHHSEGAAWPRRERGACGLGELQSRSPWWGGGAFHLANSLSAHQVAGRAHSELEDAIAPELGPRGA